MSTQNLKPSLRPEIIPKSKILLHNVFALRRSGHHAVIAWIEDCYRDSGAIPAHVNEDEHNGHVLDESDPTWRVYDADKIISIANSIDKNFKVLIVNYEDLAYSEKYHINAYNDPAWQEVSFKRCDTIIIRDWYNLVASRLKRISDDRKSGSYSLFETINWNSLAEMWIEQANLLANQHDPDLKCINFNRWRTDKSYRELLAASFGLVNAPISNKVPNYGGGSSFDGTKYDGKANKMNLSKRWSEIDSDMQMEFKKIINSAYKETINELNKEIFDFGYSSVFSESN